MKPAEVRDKIRRLKEHIALEKICIKHCERERDQKNHDERIAKQKGIIKEALRAIAKIRHQRKTAPAKIKATKRHMRWEKKELVKLENYVKIEKLKEIAALVETISKEMSDGEEHNNTKTH